MSAKYVVNCVVGELSKNWDWVPDLLKCSMNYEKPKPLIYTTPKNLHKTFPISLQTPVFEYIAYCYGLILINGLN